jgi:replicative DNA helicase
MPATLTGEMLLSRLRSLGSTTALHECSERYFTEPEEIAALQWLKEYVRQHRAFPTISTFQRETGITVRITNEPLTYYLDRARKRAIYKQINARFNAIKATLVDKDPDRFIGLTNEIAAFAQQFRPEGHRQAFAAALDQVITEFQEVKWTAGLRGIDTGYQFLNDVTGGWQNTDNIALAGRPGDGKSYLALKHAHAAWASGKSVLFQSNEMGVVQIARRMIGIHTGINPKSISRGRVGTFGERHLADGLAALKDGVPFYCYPGSFTSSTAVLRGLCEEHQPDMIIVDASYLLTPERKTSSLRENLVEVVNDLKKIAIDLNRPLLHTVQFNREAVIPAPRRRRHRELGEDPQDPGATAHLGLHKIAETDAIAANASIVLALSRPRDGENRRYYTILKGREGERGQWLINYDFNGMNFDEVAPTLDPQEQSPAIEY